MRAIVVPYAVGKQQQGLINISEDLPSIIHGFWNNHFGLPAHVLHAHEQYGQDYDDILRGLRHDHDQYDLSILVVDGHIDTLAGPLPQNMRAGKTANFIKRLSSLPVLAYVTQTTRRTRMNLAAYGVTHMMAHSDDPSTLPLMARRIIDSTANENFVYNWKNVEVDTRAVKVAVDGIPLRFPPNELEFLSYFMRNQGRGLAKSQIMNELYGLNFDEDIPDQKIVDVFMSKVRKKLRRADPSLVDMFETIWGFGYRLPTPAQFDAQQAAKARLAGAPQLVKTG